MNKTWIVSDRDSLTNLKALCFSSLENQFLTYDQIVRLHPFAPDTLPDTIVLDAESVPEWNGFVATHATLYRLTSGGSFLKKTVAHKIP